jgi:Phage minor structural protein GP20
MPKMAKDAAGKEIEVDDDDTMPDDDTDLVDADGLKDPPAYVAPSQDEWDRTTAALKKANNQARKLRQARRDGASNDSVTGVPGTAAENAAAILKATNDAVVAASKKWMPKLVASAARVSLVAAGLVGSPDRLLKMIDHDDLEVDDDGEVSGLDEQVAELKAEYPELFSKKVTKTGSVNGGRRTSSGDGKKKSSADIIAERYGVNA